MTKESLRYLAAGCITTILSFFLYDLFMRFLPILWANSLSFVCATLFSYLVNRYYVFQFQQQAYQMGILFFLLRFFALAIENTLLYFFAILLLIHPLVSKLIVSVTTFMINYACSKWIVFAKKHNR